MELMSGDIFDQDLSNGTGKYCQYGAGDMKCRVVIHVETLIQHCSTFCEQKIDHHDIMRSFLQPVLPGQVEYTLPVWRR